MVLCKFGIVQWAMKQQRCTRHMQITSLDNGVSSSSLQTHTALAYKMEASCENDNR